MRKIDLCKVSDKVCELFIDACNNLPSDVYGALLRAREEEESPLGRDVIDRIIENADLAKEKQLPNKKLLL